MRKSKNAATKHENEGINKYSRRRDEDDYKCEKKNMKMGNQQTWK